MRRSTVMFPHGCAISTTQLLVAATHKLRGRIGHHKHQIVEQNTGLSKFKTGWSCRLFLPQCNVRGIYTTGCHVIAAIPLAYIDDIREFVKSIFFFPSDYISKVRFNIHGKIDAPYTTSTIIEARGKCNSLNSTIFSTLAHSPPPEGIDRIADVIMNEKKVKSVNNCFIPENAECRL